MRYLMSLMVLVSFVACKKPTIDERSKTQGLTAEDSVVPNIVDEIPETNLLALPSHCTTETIDAKECLICSPRGFKLRECFTAPAGFKMADDCKLNGTAEVEQKVVCEKDGKKIVELAFRKRNVEEAADSVGFVSAMARVLIATKIPTDKPEKAMALDLIDFLDDNLKIFMQGDSQVDALVTSTETIILKHKPKYAGDDMNKIKTALSQGLTELQGLIKVDNINMASLMALYAKMGGQLPSGDTSKLFSLEDLTKLLGSADDKTLDLIRDELKK